MATDGNIRKIVAQTLGIVVDDTSQMLVEANTGSKPHNATASSGLEKYGEEGSLSKFATSVLEKARNNIEQGERRPMSRRNPFLFMMLLNQ